MRQQQEKAEDDDDMRVPPAADLQQLQRHEGDQHGDAECDAEYSQVRAQAVLAAGIPSPPAAIPPVELAAYAQTCALILNLDEALSRE